jgi:hypothetical protein
MRQYIDVVQDVQGNALVGATVLVQNYVGGANASIYSDNGLTPIANSTVTSGADGSFSFFAADGDYNLVFSRNSTVYKTQSPVSIFDGAPQVTFADTGTVNAYAIANSALEKALRPGLRASINIANTNTGACTFQYNGLAVKNIVFPAAIAAAAGTLIAGGIYGLEYDGTNWQVRNGLALTAAAVGGIVNPITAAETSAGVTVVNYLYPECTVERYGNNTTPGSTNMSAAVTACLSVCKQYSPWKQMTVATMCLLSSTVNIDRLHDSATTDDYFFITSQTGGGFSVATNIGMFGSTLSNGTAPASQMIYFEKINFYASAGAGVGYVLNNNIFLRMRFNACSFDYINAIGNIASTIGYSQSIQFTNCNMRRGSGAFWQSGTSSGYFSTDVHFSNNIIEAWTGDCLHLGLPIGCSVCENLLEGISGTAVVVNGTQGFLVSGNYFEANGLDIDLTGAGAQTYAVNGVAIIGNRFQNAVSTTYTVTWPVAAANIAGAVSKGNYFVGYGHSLPSNSSADINDFATGNIWNNPPKISRALTAWTPTDGSGAALNFNTPIVGNYSTNSAGVVDFDFEVTYPATASGASATIAGLPLSSAATGSSNPISGGTTYTTYTGGAITIAGSASGTTFSLYANGVALTNANLSGKTIRMFGRYQA